MLPIGCDESGTTYYADDDSAPHILIAGVNESEKFTFMRNLVKNLKKQKKVNELRVLFQAIVHQTTASTI